LKIGDPPLLAGFVNATLMLWSPGVTDVIVGAPGTVTGDAPAATPPNDVPKIATPHIHAFQPRGRKSVIMNLVPLEMSSEMIGDRPHPTDS